MLILLIQSSFGKAEGGARDNSGNIFIAYPEKDSIFKFNAMGMNLNHSGDQNYLNNPMVFPFSIRLRMLPIPELIELLDLNIYRIFYEINKTFILYIFTYKLSSFPANPY
ncbi:MAG: hypothetical protein P8X73_08415 [Ignavibacteriaceae bacterium]